MNKDEQIVSRWAMSNFSFCHNVFKSDLHLSYRYMLILLAATWADWKEWWSPRIKYIFTLTVYRYLIYQNDENIWKSEEQFWYKVKNIVRKERNLFFANVFQGYLLQDIKNIFSSGKEWTLCHLQTHFEASAVDDFWKHCQKRKKYS